MTWCVATMALMLIPLTVGAMDITKPADTTKVSVALLQMISNKDDQAANLKKADEWCRKAAALGADIALMPEMWNIGYARYPGKTRADGDNKWMAEAVDRNSEYVRHFQTLAKELNMAIVTTYLEKWPKAPRDSATLIDRHGKQVLTYAKVHTCDFGAREAACTPGDGFYVVGLDTAKGTVKVGIMICYDREHPESAECLMLKGAEIILTPNACTLDQMRIDQFKVRAYDNAVVVAMANYAMNHPKCNGQSVSYGPRGEELVRAQGDEGIYLAQVDLADLRDYRRQTISGGAFRRPRRYKDMLKDGELPEFRRTNAFGEKFDQKER